MSHNCVREQTRSGSATAVILSSSGWHTSLFFPGRLHLPVGLGVARMGHFGGTLQPPQQAVDPTQGVARPILLRDPISNFPSSPQSPSGHRVGHLDFLLRPQQGRPSSASHLCAPSPRTSPLVDTRPPTAALSGSGYPLPLPPYPSSTHSGAATSRAARSALRDPALSGRRPSMPLVYPLLATPPQMVFPALHHITSAIPTMFMASI
jgi:hypothetical protein